MPTGESKRVEYKVAVPESSEKYMKTVVAFANTQGGRLVFGVDDKTLDVVGMDEETIFQTMDALTNAISDSCEPRIVPNVTMQSVGGKTLIVVEILPGMMRPYYIRSKGMVNGTFTRVAGTSRLVSREMLKELILEGQNRFFDSEPCEGLAATDADITALCSSLKETAVRNTVEEKDKLAVKDVTPNVLRSWGVLTEHEGKIVPTNAFALLAGRMTLSSAGFSKARRAGILSIAASSAAPSKTRWKRRTNTCARKSIAECALWASIGRMSMSSRWPASASSSRMRSCIARIWKRATSRLRCSMIDWKSRHRAAS